MIITYNTNSQIKLKVSVSKSSLCDYSDAYTLAKESLSIVPAPPPAANPETNAKEVVYKNCAPFTDRIGEINNT